MAALFISRSQLRILFPHESSDSPEAARADRQRHQREVHHHKFADRDTRISIASGHNLLVPDYHEPPEVHLNSFVGTGSVLAGRRRPRREPSQRFVSEVQFHEPVEAAPQGLQGVHQGNLESPVGFSPAREDRQRRHREPSYSRVISTSSCSSLSTAAVTRTATSTASSASSASATSTFALASTTNTASTLTSRAASIPSASPASLQTDQFRHYSDGPLHSFECKCSEQFKKEMLFIFVNG